MPLLTLLLSLIVQPAHAAFLVCEYSSAPCNEQGHHYVCTLAGWTGPNPPQFCSDQQRSTGPGRSQMAPQEKP